MVSQTLSEIDELLRIDLTDTCENLYMNGGKKLQWLIYAEECSELNKAVLKSFRYAEFNHIQPRITKNMLEETAHVFFCLWGFITICRV